MAARISGTRDDIGTAVGTDLAGRRRLRLRHEQPEATRPSWPPRREVLERKVPLLGICLGAQLLTRGSEEGANRVSDGSRPIPGGSMFLGSIPRCVFRIWAGRTPSSAHRVVCLPILRRRRATITCTHTISWPTSGGRAVPCRARLPLCGRRRARQHRRRAVPSGKEPPLRQGAFSNFARMCGIARVEH